MRAAFCSVSLCALFVLGSVRAAPDIASPRGQIPLAALPESVPGLAVGLGLSKLQWGMSPEEVRAAYPALSWRDAAQAHTELRGSYRAFGCTFIAMATFAGQPTPMLKAIILDATDLSCSSDVQASLLQQFGMAQQQISPFGVLSREWRLDPNYVSFVQAPKGWLGQPQHITVTFADLTGAIYIEQ